MNELIKQYSSKWERIEDIINRTFIKIKLIKWHNRDYTEKPKNEVLENLDKTLENLDKTIKELTEWICGGNKNENRNK
jgi:hypothetical protein